ncbi:hypothetical protein [Nostoc linckia]|uniref:Uncharacterized protein n=1 Tax=Nostoc linckia z8 TaxID=1628746 RepID=A0A9Q5Z411_NOSLI|nr:hypothetical protein [Nostoc linckia]PHJ89334.1 hypothetical protein VF08_37760 [Nostoc linckia z8]
MDLLSDHLFPTDGRLPEGWPNPRAYMRDPAAVAARMNEDGRRIAAEKGDCTLTDLTRLGWLQGQVQAHQASLSRDWDKLDEEVAAALGTVEAMRADHAPAEADEIVFVEDTAVVLTPIVREPQLADEDVAFGIERAA